MTLLRDRQELDLPDAGAGAAASDGQGSRRERSDAEGSTLIALVLHARAVPCQARSDFAGRVEAMELGEGSLLLHTCHRVELYVASDSYPGPPPESPAGTMILRDADAVRHLISVACGLESAIFGEDEILHQLRTCLTRRREVGPLDPAIDRLVQAALRAGRQAHAWFAGPPRSLADVALDRVARDRGSLEGRTILVAGAGRMGRLAAWAAHRRGARVVVTNRTDERAVALAREIRGSWVPFGQAGDTALDGVVVGLAGPWHLRPAETGRIDESGAVVVDLSSPPAVPEDLQRRLGARFVSVDALADLPEFEAHDHLRPRLERLVSETGRAYCQWLRTREAVPVIQAVARSADRLRQTEMEWLLRRLPELGGEDRDVVEQMSHRLVAAILHAPLSALREDATGEQEHAARILFGL